MVSINHMKWMQALKGEHSLNSVKLAISQQLIFLSSNAPDKLDQSPSHCNDITDALRLLQLSGRYSFTLL